MRAAGVEIGSSIAYAADVTYELVKASALNSTTFTAGQSYKVVNDAGDEIARFTAIKIYYAESDNATPKLTYNSSNGGTNGTITVEKGAIKDLTIFAGTTVTCTEDAGGKEVPFDQEGHSNCGVAGEVNLTGGRATFSYTIRINALTDEKQTFFATTAADSTGTLTYLIKNGLHITGEKGAKLSELNYYGTDVANLSGELDISELDTVRDMYLAAGSTITAGGGITIKIPSEENGGDAGGKINYNKTTKTVTLISKGQYDDITISEDGKLDIANGAGVTIKNLIYTVADLEVHNIETGKNLTVKTITATDHLTVGDTLTAENVYLKGAGNGLTAGTINATGTVSANGTFIKVTNGDLTAKNVSANYITVSNGAIKATGGDVTAQNDMTVAKDITANGNVSAGQSVTATNGNITANTVSAGKDLSAKSIEAMGGAVTAGGNLTATGGDITAAGAVSAGWNLSAKSITATGGAVTAGGNLTATGGDITAAGAVTAGGNLSAKTSQRRRMSRANPSQRNPSTQRRFLFQRR